MAYWISQGDETKGPYTLKQLVSMWSSGHLTSDTLYYHPDKSQWQRLKDLIEPHIEPRPTPLPPLKASAIENNHDDAPIQHENPLSLSGRVKRGEFFLINVVYAGVLGLVLYALSLAMVSTTEVNQQNLFVALGSGLAILIYSWLVLVLVIKRIHDLGQSGWRAFLAFVPIVNMLFAMWLLFTPGKTRL